MKSGKMSSCLLRVRQEDRCVLFVKTLSRIIEDMILIHYKKHQAEVEEKLKLVLGSELRKEYVIKKRMKFKGDKIYLLKEVVKVWR